MSSNEDNNYNIKKELEYNGIGYDFFGHDFELPGEICIDLFEITRQFKEGEWYSCDEIYDLSGGILNDIWLDPDNPYEIIYIDFQAYDNHDVTRELISINILEISYNNNLSMVEFSESFNDEVNEESNEEFNEEFNEESNEESNEELVRKENIISYSNYTRPELSDRFIYSRLYLGYDYKSIINDYGDKQFKLLPVKNKVLSLKNLSGLPSN